MNQVTAPWTADQVHHLNEYQHLQWFHPFTCGNCRDKLHTHVNGYFDDRLLVATTNGWICPTCDYTQDWAWDMMVEPAPEWAKRNPFRH